MHFNKTKKKGGGGLVHHACARAYLHAANASVVPDLLRLPSHGETHGCQCASDAQHRPRWSGLQLKCPRPRSLNTSTPRSRADQRAKGRCLHYDPQLRHPCCRSRTACTCPRNAPKKACHFAAAQGFWLSVVAFAPRRRWKSSQYRQSIFVSSQASNASIQKLLEPRHTNLVLCCSVASCMVIVKPS